MMRRAIITGLTVLTAVLLAMLLLLIASWVLLGADTISSVAAL